MAAVLEVPKALLADLGKATSLSDLLAAIEEHDHYTGSHSCRVAAYSAMIGGLMGLGDVQVDVLRRAGMVHDIGKLHISRKVLRKSGTLTESEVAEIHMHPITGAMMLTTVKDMMDLIPIVLHHHERWDGRGYPTGISGIDIPLESRIIFVADAFDAMTTAHTYGRRYNREMAIQEIERCAGWQFDPLVARTMRMALTKGWLEPDPERV